MRRVLLFLGTNLAVLLVASIVLQLLGVDDFLGRHQVGIDLRGLLIFSAVFGMSGSFVSLLISKWMAKRGVGAVVIGEPRTAAEQWLVETVQRHARAAGIGMPEVAVYEHPTPNAFATGWRRDDALVAVSTGLLRGMRPEEIEAVLGHEISHVANGDMVTLALIQGVVNTFVLFLSRVVGLVVDRAVFRTERGVGPGYFVVSIVAQLAFGILATLIVMAFSRWREFRADAGGARLAGRERMIAALERLRAGAREPLPGALAAFGIAGGRGAGLARLFASHPPLDERIARLRGQVRVGA